MHENFRLITPFEDDSDPRIYEVTYPGGCQYAVYSQDGMVEICKDKVDAYAIASQFLKN